MKSIVRDLLGHGGCWWGCKRLRAARQRRIAFCARAATGMGPCRAHSAMAVGWINRIILRGGLRPVGRAGYVEGRGICCAGIAMALALWAASWTPRTIERWRHVDARMLGGKRKRRREILLLFEWGALYTACFGNWVLENWSCSMEPCSFGFEADGVALEFRMKCLRFSTCKYCLRF